MFTRHNRTEKMATNNDITMSPLVRYLIDIQQNMTWSMMIFLIFGNIGNICNCFIFLQKSLRSNPCSHYLLISSIANIIALTFFIPTNIYALIKTNPNAYSLIYCKLRLYIYHTLLMISRYLIIFACIDRACLSSRQVFIRNFSQIRLARILCIIIIIFWFIATIHIPIMDQIQSGYCIMPGIYSLIFSIYVVIFAGFIPPILMSVCSLITLRNLHSVHVRIHTTNIQTNRVMRRRDFHLTRMLTAQVVVYILTTTPYPLNTLYAAITLSNTKNNDQQVIESFIYFITSTFLLFINPSASFYIYIVTSKAFRKEFKIAFINLRRMIFCRERINAIVPSRNPRFTRRIIPQQQGGFQTSSTVTIRPVPSK